MAKMTKKEKAVVTEESKSFQSFCKKLSPLEKHFLESCLSIAYNRGYIDCLEESR